MTSTEWLTIGEAVAYLGEPIERVFKLLEQGTIVSEGFGNGQTLVSKDSCDLWLANCPKPTAETTAPAPVDKFSMRWTRAEDKYLREHYLTETKEEIARALGRTPNGVEHRKCYLGSKKRLIGPEYITGPQAAAMLGRSQTYPYGLAATGKLHPVTVPGGVKKLFLKSEVAAIVERGACAEIERPAVVEKMWSADRFGDAVGLSGGRVRRLCKEGKIPARFVSEEKPAGGRAGHWVIPDSSRIAYLAKKRRAAVPPSDLPVPVAAPVENVPVFVRNRRAAERKDRAAFQAKPKAEVAEVTEPEPTPAVTVETAPAARGGLLARVASACAIFKRRRA